MHPLIQHAPDPDHPGWWTWDVAGEQRYNATIGKLLVRAEGPGRARCRVFPSLLQSNLADFVHGGAILTFVDIAMFAGGKLAGISDTAQAVTLDLSCQFIDAGRPHAPLDCDVELLRETGRLAFLRGLVEQDGRTIASWTGTLRKGGERR